MANNKKIKDGGCYFEYRDYEKDKSLRKRDKGSDLRKFKKISEEEAYNRIRSHIEYSDKKSFTKEGVSWELEIRVGMVTKIFQRLNLDGVLTQRKPEYAHDTNRNPMFHANSSGWAASIYYKVD